MMCRVRHVADSETSITTSPLVIACQNGHSDVVELLLEKDIEQINTKKKQKVVQHLFSLLLFMAEVIL